MTSEVCHERDPTARAGTDRAAHRTIARSPTSARRHHPGQRQGRRGLARARPGLRGRVHRAQEPRHQLRLHGPQDQLRRGRRADLPALQPADRRDRGRAPGPRAAGQALLSARPDRQGGTHRRAPRRPGSRPREVRPTAPATTMARRQRSGDASRGGAGRPRPPRAAWGARVMAEARTLFDKIWDVAPGRAAGRRHLPALHRPPSGPRGHQPAGLRGPARDRAQGAPARRDARRPRPQRADHRPLQGHRRGAVAHPGRDPAAELPRLRHPAVRRRGHPPGHRPHHRPRAGLHAARA